MGTSQHPDAAEEAFVQFISVPITKKAAQDQDHQTLVSYPV